MKHEPKMAWAIVHWDGGIYVDTTCTTRREAVRCFKEAYRVTDKKWKDDVKFGVHRAVKVTVAIAAR